MRVRGAPLIGATAAYGIYLAMIEDPSTTALNSAYKLLSDTRPTAINLRWALDKTRERLATLPLEQRQAASFTLAEQICKNNVDCCYAIGLHGANLLREIHKAKATSKPLNVLTHCNAGWLAAVDWGTALAPIYLAHDLGVPLHIWVDETRPRNQGASLTAWELDQHGIPHTIIVDNVGGHLMQHGMVDLCITGSDRTTANGDVCNKIGTYLKALAANDNNIPFYVALPHNTIDWSITDGLNCIPIEQRDACEVTHIKGVTKDGDALTVRIVSESSPVANYAFDVTPARLITGLITERGICDASKKGLLSVYKEADHEPI